MTVFHCIETCEDAYRHVSQGKSMPDVLHAWCERMVTICTHLEEYGQKDKAAGLQPRTGEQLFPKAMALVGEAREPSDREFWQEIVDSWQDAYLEGYRCAT